MKINIGPYLTYWGPNQISEAILFWLPKDHSYVEKLGDMLDCIPGFTKMCNWIYNNRQRRIQVKIHPYDTWSMDATLALIILPMLKQLKETKHGSAMVDQEDVPENLRTVEVDQFGEYIGWEERWNWVLDEMIWAFQNHDPRVDFEDQFYDQGWFDHNASLRENLDKMKFDRDGYTAWMNRKQNGFRLFGKYFTGLWD